MKNKVTRAADYGKGGGESPTIGESVIRGRRVQRVRIRRNHLNSSVNATNGGALDPLEATRARLAGMNVLVVGEMADPVDRLYDSLRGAGVKAEILMDRLLVDSSILKHMCCVIVVSYEGDGTGGIVLVRRLRAAGDNRPILLICPGADAAARIKAFKAGVDDCLSRPFEMEEFVLRVRSLMRRASPATSPVLHVRDLALDTLRRTAHRSGREIELTKREFRLLEFLMRSAGRSCTREAISDAVWGGELTSDSNLIEVYVQRLRGKLEVGTEAKVLHSIRGVGYVMRCGQHSASAKHCVYTACVVASN